MTLAVTYHYDVSDMEKIWLTNDKQFYDMIMGKPNAVPMFTPDLAEAGGICLGQFAGFYLVGTLRETMDSPSQQASQGE